MMDEPDVVWRMVEAMKAKGLHSEYEEAQAAARVLLAHAAASQALMPDVPFDVPSYARSIGIDLTDTASEEKTDG